ncbi:MAG: AmmeMemoRadiSam system protein A [Anaerolineaceae bacterium]|nr:AmmeMemoRadiSam system protein A [Anaerolineaceae bacterium]
MNEHLTDEDKKILLTVAREAIVNATQNKKVDDLDIANYSKLLREYGASFVTLHKKSDGQLRGCIGVLEAYQPLVKDVQHHAVAAALEDYRFPPVTFNEIHSLNIEISRLTAPVNLKYDNPMELPAMLKPGLDGVILKDGFRKATFLPQVWEQLPDPEEFLAHLCRKMGDRPDRWKLKLLEVSTYQVEEFHE